MKIGIDIVHIPKFKRICEKWGEKFLSRIFTKEELKFSFANQNPYIHLAARFAAKESTIKALGILNRIFKWKDMEFERPSTMKLKFAHNTKNIAISLSHTDEYAVAVSLVEE